MHTMTKLRRNASLALSLCALAACGGDEDPPTSNGHDTVEAAAIFTEDGTPMTEPIGIPEEGSLRLEVRFLDGDGTTIGGLRPDHDAALVFEPAGMANVVADHGANGFFFNVEAAAAAGTTGVVFVGYGHDGDTDESRFGPFDAVIVDVVE